MAGGQGIGRARSVAGELPVATRAVLGAGRGVGGVLGNAGGELRAIAEGLRTPAGAVDVLAGMTPFGTPVQVGTQLARDPSAGLGSAMARTAMPLDLVEQSPGWSSAVSNAVGQLADLLTASRELGTPGGWQNVSRRSRERLGKMVGGIGKGFYDAPVASTLGMLAPALNMASAHAPAAGVMEDAGLTAWHGTPHTFAPTEKNPLGEFDLSKMGSGEGAQAYGWGQYLAEEPRVAQQYIPDRSYVGKTMAGTATAGPTSPIEIAQATLNEFGTHDAAIEHLKKVLRQNSSSNPAQVEANKDLVSAINELKSGNLERQGSLYRVEIPDEYVDKMLDNDADISKQSDYVKKALKGIKAPPIRFFDGMRVPGGGTLRINKSLEELPKRGQSLITTPFSAYPYVLEIGDSKFGMSLSDVQRLFGSSNSGASLYTRLSHMLGSDKAASEFLRSKGIYGIKYFDQFSRPGASGTRNFVLFDPSIATITDRK